MEQTPFLRVNVGPEHISYSEFVKEGYTKLMDEPSEIKNSIIDAKDLILLPHNDEVYIKFHNYQNMGTLYYIITLCPVRECACSTQEN